MAAPSSHAGGAVGTRTPGQKAPGIVPSGKPVAAVAVAALVVLGGLTAGLWSVSGAGSPAPQIPGSVAAPTATQITPVCQTTIPASALGPATSLPTNPVTAVVAPSAGGVVNFTATSSALYVNTGSRLVTYSLAGVQESSFALPAHFTGNSASAPVVDPAGDIYLSSYYGQLVDKFSPSGALLWGVDPKGGNPTGLFSVGTGGSFQVAVSLVQVGNASELLNPANGSVTGTFPLVDNGFVTQESDGNLLYAANGYVETVSPTGKVLSTFGSSHIEGSGVHTGGGTQVYYPAQAVQGPDGTIYTADPLTTVEATSPTGIEQGASTLGGSLDFGGWNFVLIGSTFYFQNGPPYSASGDGISSFTLATLQAYLSAVQRPADTLGWGAGLSTSATGNYFAPGSTPAVVATFDPWWTSLAAHLTLSYSVENQASLDAGTIPPATTLPLPTSASGLASIPLALPTGDTLPGPYQVRATLLDDSTSPPSTLGTTCLPYTVGAPGDRLNFATLPAGSGAGGPADPRGVALNAQLGLSGLRSSTVADWSTLLPNCSATAPTAATCGPSAMSFSTASTDPYLAAHLAIQDHVSYWMQVSGGDAVSTALVHGGWWQGDVAALVAHYATVPAGCTGCSPVTKWEPWNEPNNTGWPNGGTYVTSVLAPFYAAVKSVLPGSESTVIGGSSLEPSIGWWQQLIAAGGLADMDVAAIHPYTGSNESYEEDGMPAQVRQLQALLGSKPLWFSEVGWWSDGDYDYVAQADDTARALIWQKVLGVPVENYFFDEGSWGNNGVSFSLVQAAGGVDYVKPAALSTMTASGELAGRPFVSTPSTGIPQGYEADFGPVAGGSTDLAAVWTDGLATPASVTVTDPSGGTDPVTVTDEYGGATTAQAVSGTAYSLALSDHVTYLTYPAGDTLTVGPTEAYGTDVASSAAGAQATASSGNASAAIAGLTVGYGQGWTSAPGDSTPSLTVTLASATTIDRVLVDTQSVGSTAPGIRDYTVSGDEPGSGWVTLATEPDQFRDHVAQFAIVPTLVTALRITVSQVNFGGYFGGGIPPWWSPTQQDPAFIHAVEAFAGTGGPSVVAGTALPPLLGTSTGGGTGGGTTTTDPVTTTTQPGATTTTGAPTTTTTTPPGGSAANGYRLVNSAAQVASFGSDSSYGPTGALALNRPIVGMASAPDGKGYWLVGADGGIFNFGDAGFYGSVGNLGLNAPIVGMAATPDGKGYWLVASDGGVFAFGDAGFNGSTGAITLNKPIVGMAATPDGGGYWLVASDGGIFAFGDAVFHGSTGGITLNKPIVGMASTADGGGYWLVAAEGGVFAFGDAPFLGSGADPSTQPVVAIDAG